MTSDKDTVSPSTPAEHLTGRVKWFNNKAGYGFITVTDSSRSGSDIFVHHSSIDVENQQYKYLIQGEYVEFDLIKTDSEKHEWQSSNVAGIKGGKLMCETRHELKQSKTEYKSTKDTGTNTRETTVQREMTTPRQREPTTPRQRAPRETKVAPRLRGEGPRASTKVDSDGKEWTLVAKSTQPVQKSRPRKAATIESK